MSKQLTIAIVILFACFLLSMIGQSQKSQSGRAHEERLRVIELQHEHGTISEAQCDSEVMQELRTFGDADTALVLASGHAHRYIRE